MATGVQISSFAYVGAPTLSAIFGFFKTSAGTQIQRLQITAQVPPLGGNITVQLVDQAGNSYAGASIELQAGISYYDQPLAAPISLGLGKIVRAQITGVDNGTGADLVLNLIGATVQGANPPSGACGPSNCQPPSAQLLFFQGNVQNEVEAAQAAQAAAETAANNASASATAANTAKTAAQAAQTGAETAETNTQASVTQAAAWATNANNAASAAQVYANNANTSANTATAAANLANAAAAEAQSGIKAATLQLTPASTQTIATATPTAVQWNNAQFDDFAFFSAANPTRLTIPPNRGIERVCLKAGIRWTANGTGERKIKIRGNGGTYPANSIFSSDDRPSDATGDATIVTGVILVQDNMYFEVIVEQNSGAGLDINTAATLDNFANFFTIEVMKRTV